MAKYLGETGLIYLWSKIKTWVSNYAKITSSTGKDTITAGNNSVDVYDWAQASTKPSYTADEISDGTTYKRFSATEKEKLFGIAANADVNMIEVVEIPDPNEVDGDTVQLSRTNKIISIPAVSNTSGDETYGLMAPSQKTKLDSLSADSDVVHIDGIETISGSKEFTNQLTVSSICSQVSYDNTSDFTWITNGGSGPYSLQDALNARDNQNAFSNVKVGNSTIAADGTTDTLELAVASNSVVSLTADTTNDKITIDVDKDLSKYNNTTSAFIASSLVGAANGICPLDANTKIASSYLPSYVDDVIEAYIRSGQTALSSTWLATGSASGTVITPEAGKIYVLMNSDSTYSENTEFRWGSSAYVKINDGGISEMTTAEMDTATSNWT